jgi:hypothetical protein
MARDIIATQRTAFRPERHGFRFSNSHIPWRFLGASGTALCGGMAYSALDYFFHGLSIPATATAPLSGTQLNDYILQRQIAAHQVEIPMLARTTAQSNESVFRRAISLRDDFGRLVRSIDANRPVPLLMVSTSRPMSTASHWAVAIGYEIDEAPPDAGGRSCGRVILYDSNHPGVLAYLTPNRSQQWFDHSFGATYRTYWADTGFGARDPRQHPLEAHRRGPAPREPWPRF